MTTRVRRDALPRRPPGRRRRAARAGSTRCSGSSTPSTATCRPTTWSPRTPLVERAGSRLALSRDHTVVALAGTTGSGKSSLFNALARLQALTGRRAAADHRPWRTPACGARRTPPAGCSTGSACCPATGSSGRAPLDGDDEAALRGLVLLDLPDFDSVERGPPARGRPAARPRRPDHLGGRPAEVRRPGRAQRLPARVPPPPRHHRRRAQPGRPAVRRRPADSVLADLRRLLDDDGLAGVPVLATAAVQQPGDAHRAAPPAGEDGRRAAGRAAPALRRRRQRRVRGSAT